MADIREHYENQGDNTFLRARSSERMEDKINLGIRHAEIMKQEEVKAQELDIPVWLLRARAEVEKTPAYKPPLKLSVKGNGDLFYRDSLGCKIELVSEAKKRPHHDGMLLSEFVA